MALNKSAAPAVEAPKAETPAQSIPAEAKAATTRSQEDKRAHGQVRMHAIICGYRVGGALAATLGTSPASVKDELHKLAAEVADKIEEYSFHD